mgnify:CR=1 FL=1
MNNNSLKPTYVPGKSIKSLLEANRLVQMTGQDRVDTNVQSSSSFFYDPPALGLKSTQQLNVDWSKFENHTFFNSAEVNVNVVFDQIINNFPFDGTRKEHELFFERLTGFEKWVYDQFPKNSGFLLFSGTQPNEDTNGTLGTFISVTDYAGGPVQTLSKNKSGKSVLDPTLGSFTIEMHLFLADKANSMQVICQKLSDPTHGFSSFIKPTSNVNNCEIAFAIVSGSVSLITSATLDKGKFNHVCLVHDKKNAKNKSSIIVNGNVLSETEKSINFGLLGIEATTFYIGSGSQLDINGSTLTPTQTLSGALDEFRFFHKARTIEQINTFAKKSIYSIPELKLYYKFNEPNGWFSSDENDSINRIVLDSSGNSLHSYISEQSYHPSLRGTILENPLTLEKQSLCPVLFPGFDEVYALNSKLLHSASVYDQANPNLITRLIPSHYFVDGRQYEGLDSDNGTINREITEDGKLGTTQLMLSFLYVWAKFFDELKLYIDAFSDLNFVDYNAKKSIPDHFLPVLMKQFGFDAPPFFLDSSIEQYIDGENIQPVISSDEQSLQFVQNQIMRRVLTNITEIVKSKGTQHSVKAFMRTVGIDPDNSFRIREFGGPTKRQLEHARESRLVSGRFLDFTGNGKLTSPYLSSSRAEVGFPAPSGQFNKGISTNYHGISNNRSDGLYTSGSWTYEAIYRFPVGRQLSGLTQSLVQMFVKNSNNVDNLVMNVVAVTGSSTGVKAYFGVCNQPNVSPLELSIDSVDVFDGKPWNVVVGRTRNDAINSAVSSSYFLTVGNQQAGEITNITSVQSFWNETGNVDVSHNVLQNVTNDNVFGPTLKIGSSSLSISTGSFLNSVNTSLTSKTTNFNGQVSKVRFWTKDLSITEIKEHIRNFQSLGVNDPTKNFNFETVRSGSWERLRCDLSMDQQELITDSNGFLKIFDFSQNNCHFSGSFVSNTNVFKNSSFSQNSISPVFDEAATNEKVRIRSFQDYELAKDTPWAEIAPVYQIRPSEAPTDDTRFAIEFSIIDALNRDIILIFSTLDSLENALGNPELVFSQDYPTLETLREIYFKRLTDKINIKSFFDFFRWFDTSIGGFIEQLIPRKTKFYGTNFVIESHMLERPKFEHNYSDIYLVESDRHHQRDTLLVQQIVGTCVRY